MPHEMSSLLVELMIISAVAQAGRPLDPMSGAQAAAEEAAAEGIFGQPKPGTTNTRPLPWRGAPKLSQDLREVMNKQQRGMENLPWLMKTMPWQGRRPTAQEVANAKMVGSHQQQPDETGWHQPDAELPWRGAETQVEGQRAPAAGGRTAQQVTDTAAAPARRVGHERHNWVVPALLLGGSFALLAAVILWPTAGKHRHRVVPASTEFAPLQQRIDDNDGVPIRA